MSFLQKLHKNIIQDRHGRAANGNEIPNNLHNKHIIHTSKLIAIAFFLAPKIKIFLWSDLTKF